MKESILWTLGVAGMIVLGYLSAVYAQDIVWLLAPAAVIIIAIVSVTKIFR